MSYRDLRDFITQLEALGELKRVAHPVDPHLQMTEVCDRTLRAGGPALLFENPAGFEVPVLGNLFGTTRRVALGMGEESIEALRAVGELLAFLKEPQPPNSLTAAVRSLPRYKKVLDMAPKVVRKAPCQAHVQGGAAVALQDLPIQTCWPGDAGPLITWGLVVTRGPLRERQNMGIYRQQVIDSNRVIMRWLAHRGGALDYVDWCREHPGEPFPLAVALGADPATMLAAVTPVPDALSEHAFAGLLRGSRTELVRCRHADLLVPARAEYVLEGEILPNDTAEEGPFGDHTGYYNETERFPVFTVRHLYHREQPIYHSTYTGRPPDEPAVLGVALNEVFVPILQKQFPEIHDFYLPPEGCSYRLAVVSIDKRYPGHARRIMLGIWSYLRQFTYTKFVVVVDRDIDVRNWQDVIWAITTRMDPQRDTLFVDTTPIDYLDFASPVPGLGSKMGLDATAKLPGETDREWGRPIRMSESVQREVDAMWEELGI